MSLFWILAALMGLIAALFMLWPLLRRSNTVGEREASIAVLRDQLRELERDKEAARIGPEEARAAKVEIERRALVADRLASGSNDSSNWRAGLVASAAILTPVLAGFLYLDLGSPQLATRNSQAVMAASNSSSSDPANPAIPGDMAERTEILEQRLQAEGGSFDDWWLLAQSLMFMQEPGRAADALAKASELNDDPAIKAAQAEMLIQANGGRVTPEAENLLGEVLKANPADPRARYYKGVAAAQAQFFDDALTIWSELLADTPEDAPWREAVVQGIKDVAQASGRDGDQILADAGAQAPSAIQPPNLDELRARLENEPKDYEGWLALAQGEMSSGNEVAARAAIERVRGEYEGAPFVQQQISQAERAMGLLENAPRGPTAEDVAAAQELSADDQLEMIKGMVGGLAARLEDQPDDPEGWMMLMRSYGVLGDRESGQQAYRSAIAQFDGNASLLAELEQQARTLGIIE